MSTTLQTQGNLATLDMVLQPVNDRIDTVHGEIIEGGVPGKMDQLDDTKEAIRQVINQKGIAVTAEEPFSVYPDKISQLPALREADDWQPNPTWWDIEKILKDDPDDFPYKAIFLLTDSYSTTTLGFGFRYKTSDGSVYDNWSQTTVHTWNPQADKISNAGYNTRYIIAYGDTNHPVYNNTLFPNTLYLVVGNGFTMSGNIRGGFILECYTGVDKQPANVQTISSHPQYDVMTWGYSGCLKTLRVTMNNWPSVQRAFTNCGSLQNFEVTGLSATGYFGRAWMDCASLKKLEVATSNGYDFNQAWSGCSALQQLKVDLSKATNADSAFAKCVSLLDLDVTQLDIPIDLSESIFLTPTSLVRLLNQLKDRTERNSQTLTLGRENLAKLTPEQKAIATNKNWVLA